MDISSLGSSNNKSAASLAAADGSKSFREADFMKILLSEITKQDPFKPQETSQIVDSMQKLQQLENSKFEKFRDDQRWAQDLMGKGVTVQQMNVTDAQATALKNQGLDLDRGYGTVSGKVDSFRIAGEVVYLTVGGKNYAIDNVRQINPSNTAADSAQFGLASGLLGKTVGYHGDTATDRGTGRVSAVSLGSNNQIMLTIGEKQIPFDHVDRITL